MGSEALSKATRRDIRRAYAPEASEEVLKFVDGVKKELNDRCVGMERAAAQALEQRAVAVEQRTRRLGERLDAVLLNSTFRQRLRWLIRGRWV